MRTWEVSETPAAITRVAFAPDGRSLAVAGGTTVRLLDIAGGRARATLDGHASPVLSLAFSPDGRWVASAGGDHGGPGEAILWDAATGALRARLEGIRGRVEELAFSPDSRTLIAAGDDEEERGGIMTRWEAETGRLLSSVRIEAGDAHCLAIAPDGLTVAAGGWGSGHLTLCDAATGATLVQLEGAHPGPIQALAFSPDGVLLASASAEPAHGFAGMGPRDVPPEVNVWGIAEGQLVHQRRFPGVGGLAFSPDGTRLAVGDAAVTVRELDTGRSRGVFLSGEDMGLSDLAFSPDGATLATAGIVTGLTLWDADAGRARQGFRSRTVLALAYAPDGRTLAAGFDDGAVALRDVAEERVRLVLRGRGDWAADLAFSPDGDWLAVADREGVRFWRPETGQAGWPLSLSWSPTVPPTSVAFAPVGDALAVGMADGTVQVWDTAEYPPRLRRTLRGHEGRIQAVTFAPDGRTLVSAGEDGAVRTWDAAEGLMRSSFRFRSYRVLPRGDGIESVIADESDVPEARRDAIEERSESIAALALAPDGETMALGAHTSFRGPGVSVRDAATGRERVGFTPGVSPEGGVHDLSFSPDGRTLAVAGYGVVVLADPASGRAPAILKGRGMGVVRRVVFSPDGKELAAGGTGVVQFWDLDDVFRGTEPE
ncbi:WD40 repeat domain-containing protein [Tautonia sp. JC769]|uniref:WD40 repeat domain-containing protein n=1 Tax=Tautonia sp. JC769 TaxID=3232135 RepID=UPI0034593520